MDYKRALNNFVDYLNEQLVRFADLQLVLATIAEKDCFIRLPCFIYYSLVFQLFVKVWCGCFGAARRFEFSDLECDFLFRWFLLGGVFR
jgi:hypothetical protein